MRRLVNFTAAGMRRAGVATVAVTSMVAAGMVAGMAGLRFAGMVTVAADMGLWWVGPMLAGMWILMPVLMSILMLTLRLTLGMDMYG
jgi:hypothetical protein